MSAAEVPNTGEVRSDNADIIAYSFVIPTITRKASSSTTPTSSVPVIATRLFRTTLKTKTSKEPWATPEQRSFLSLQNPPFGRVAVKVINHLGDDVMKVSRT